VRRMFANMSTRAFTTRDVLKAFDRWDPERAAELARMAYRYVASVYPREAGYAPLDKYTDAACSRGAGRRRPLGVQGGT
jgi:hypothetical protein